jgi:outer membrane biosynthesis protein TonB
MRLAIMLFGAAWLAACGPEGGGNESAEEAGVTIGLPPELPRQVQPPPPEPPAAPEEAEALSSEEAEPPAKKAEPAKPSPPEAEPKAEEAPQPEEEEPPAAASEAPRPPAARPPLGDAEIARTIDRIGYRCGSVVSAARVDGSASGPPTYRIACSSGETYRGTNRSGRMYFRPWDR